MLLAKGWHGTFGDVSGNGLGDLLHSNAIDIASGSVVANGASGNNFASLCRQVVEFVEFCGSQVAGCHDASGHEVKTKTTEKVVTIKL